jgi:hypothetical protein
MDMVNLATVEPAWRNAVLLWIGLAVVTFINLFYLKIRAPFGRHTRDDWGPMINNSFGWFIMELPSLLCLWGGFLFFRSENTPQIALLPMALWSLHYFNRTFIYPLRLKDKKKKMPAVIAASAIFFNLVNGTVNGVFLAKGWFFGSTITVVIGCLVFFAGMYINIRSDNMLIALRKPGESTYTIPHGFLFEKVSSPNLFGEIIEWLGFFIVAPGLASLSFWSWTMANLVPRARDHHQWYLEKFSDYPADRKVLIPGIW